MTGVNRYKNFTVLEKFGGTWVMNIFASTILLASVSICVFNQWFEAVTGASAFVVVGLLLLLAIGALWSHSIRTWLAATGRKRDARGILRRPMS